MLGWYVQDKNKNKEATILYSIASKMQTYRSAVAAACKAAKRTARLNP